MSTFIPLSESSTSTTDVDHGRQLLEQLAAMSRRAYMDARRLTVRPDTPISTEPVPSWDGGCDTLGITHRAVWPSVAAFFLRYRVEPALFYQAQREESRLALPQLLSTQVALDRYEPLKVAAIQTLPVDWNCQQRRFLHGLSSITRIYPSEAPEKLQTFTLLNDSLSMSPLFRYCVARLLGLPDVAVRYAEQAKWQLLPFMEGYQTHWSPVVPLDFVAEVEKQREAALHG